MQRCYDRTVGEAFRLPFYRVLLLREGSPLPYGVGGNLHPCALGARMKFYHNLVGAFCERPRTTKGRPYRGYVGIHTVHSRQHTIFQKNIKNFQKDLDKRTNIKYNNKVVTLV